MLGVKTILISAAFLFTESLVFARAMKVSEAEAEITKISYLIYVNSDGSFTRRHERDVKITSLQAIDEYGTYQRTYPSKDAYEIISVSAATINGDQKIEVPDSAIQIATSASDASGFDENQKLTIAFPAVKKGSTIRFIIETKMTKPYIPGHFDFASYFGTYLPIKNARVEIYSEKKLFSGAFFDNEAFTVTEKEHPDAKKYKYSYLAKNNKTLFYQEIFEDSSHLDTISGREAYLRFSSSKSYSEMAMGIISSYEKVLNEGLPEIYKDLANQAKKAESIAEQTDIITSELSKSHRYMGDWRTVKGTHIPRNLSDIAQTKYGDCKDFSAVVTAILRHLGHTAHIAWIYRNETNYPLLKDIPSDREFNHAIVYVSHQDKDYWIDPTNTISVNARIRTDIMDRYALILDKNQPVLKKTPLAKPEERYEAVIRTLYQSEDNEMMEDLDLICAKRCADEVTSFLLSRATPADDELWMEALQDYVPNAKVQELSYSASEDFVSKDIKVKASVLHNKNRYKTSAGFTKSVSAKLDWLVELKHDTIVSDILLGEPLIDVSEQLIKNATLVGSAPEACEVDSPWLRLMRSIETIGEDIKITTQLEKRQSYIPNNEIKSAVFKKFISELKACDYDFSLIYQFR